MQSYSRIYWYIRDYQNLIYEFYAKHAIAFLTTYYNIDKNNTIWDNVNLTDGSYERVGELTGMKFNKYLLLPVFFITEVNTPYDGSEYGFIKAGESELVIPHLYGIEPYEGDIIKMEQDFLRQTNDIYPLFMVTGKETSTNADKTFYKLKIEKFQSKTTEQVDKQVTDIFVFFDYTKKIYTINEASFLSRMVVKNHNLYEQVSNLFDENSGLYFI